MKFNTENFLINNAVLYLSKYILLNNNFESFSVNGFNQNLNQLYYNKKYFCNALDYFIKNDFVENIVFKVEKIVDDKTIKIVIDKNSKNFELPFWKMILKTQKYFNDYLNENIYYYPSITFNKINKNKLIDFINEYLNLWLDNNLKLKNKMFYKKEKQLELVVWYIKELLSEYSSKDLLINLEKLYNSTYVICAIWMWKIEDYQVDVLITLIYLETKEVIKIKEFRLWNSFEDIYIIIDVDEEKIKLNNFEINENSKDTIIKDFLEKINKLKILEKEKCLKTRLEQDLIIELRNYNYKEIISDEIVLLKIEKLLSHPQTIWADRRWFSNLISPYILEWETLYNEIIWSKDENIINEPEETKGKLDISKNYIKENIIKEAPDLIKETSRKTKIIDEIINELNKIEYEIKNNNYIWYSNSYEYIGLKIYNIYYKIVDKTETLLLSKNFYNSKDSLLKKINMLIEYKLIDKALLNDFLVFIRVKEFYDNKAGISNLFEENALKCWVKIILILKKLIDNDNPENNNLKHIIDDTEILFSFKKINQELYIEYKNKKEFRIKKVIFDSDYELVANEMYNSETWIIEKKGIEEKYNRTIDNLSVIKKSLGFNNILLKLFFNWSSKNKINFIKSITWKILKAKNIKEKDVLLYLEEKSR